MASLLLGVIYLSFISLGLPDSLLGAAWPTMCVDLGVSVSAAGIISAIISVGTIISSLLSDRLTYLLGTGKIAAVSVLTTAVSLFGFSKSSSLLLLCLWAIPYGLGAGSVDAALNNYVALHYAARHMSWLHCMWGVGASVGPYVMGFALSNGNGWSGGYRYIALIQILLTLMLFLSLPLWKKRVGENAAAKPLGLKKALSLKGAVPVTVTFFCYCALEQTAALWASSYLAFYCRISEDKAASLACLLYLGITVGRVLCGFMTLKLSDRTLIRSGQAVILIGIITLFIPAGTAASCAGLTLIGLGCAPIYPSIIHSTPAIFGADKSQAIIGIQMAGAYIGTCTVPPLFGLLAGRERIYLLPVYLLVILVLMTSMHEKLIKTTG